MEGDHGPIDELEPLQAHACNFNDSQRALDPLPQLGPEDERATQQITQGMAGMWGRRFGLHEKYGFRTREGKS